MADPATYLSWLVDDLWYVLLMLQPPEEMLKIRRACPFLRTRGQDALFLRDYRRVWKDQPISDLADVICQNEAELQDLLSDYQYHFALLLNSVYEYGEMASVDWLLQTFPKYLENKPKEEYQADFFHRIIHLGLSTPEQLVRSNWKDPELVAKIQALFPEADYTDYYWNLSWRGNQGPANSFDHPYRYDPKKLLFGFVNHPSPSLVNQLLAKHTFDPNFLYYIVCGVQDRMPTNSLLTPEVVELIIEKENYSLIRRLLEEGRDFSSLYQAKHHSFLTSLLEIIALENRYIHYPVTCRNLKPVAHLVPTEYTQFQQFLQNIQE